MFKKIIAITAALIVTPTVMAQGGFQGGAAQGGFQGSVSITPVRTVISSGRDDQSVIMEGNVTRQLSQDTFTFTDGTGSITIDMDDDMHRYLPRFDANTRVRVYGEIDQDFRSKQVDVDHLEVI